MSDPWLDVRIGMAERHRGQIERYRLALWLALAVIVVLASVIAIRQGSCEGRIETVPWGGMSTAPSFDSAKG